MLKRIQVGATVRQCLVQKRLDDEKQWWLSRDDAKTPQAHEKGQKPSLTSAINYCLTKIEYFVPKMAQILSSCYEPKGSSPLKNVYARLNHRMNATKTTAHSLVLKA